MLLKLSINLTGLPSEASRSASWKDIAQVARTPIGRMSKMFVDVPKEISILIDGPSDVRVVSGKVSVFGADLPDGFQFSVALGKRIPATALEQSSVELRMDEGSSYSLLSEDPIPESWKEVAGEIVGSGMSKVMVIGESDVGKSSFCLYLSNLAAARGKKTGVIDADIGQADIGPPGTVGLALLSDQRVSLRGVPPLRLSFVGAKNPSSAILPLLRSIRRMRKGALKIQPDLLVINTDGWISGDVAAYLKYVTAEIFEVQVVVAIKKQEELDELIGALDDYKIMSIRTPEKVLARDREIRRETRRQNFARFLEKGSQRRFPLKLVHGLNQSEEWRGLLVGLEGERGRLLGIGTIELVDWGTKEVCILTPVEGEVQSIQVGKIRLDRDCNEIEDIA